MKKLLIFLISCFGIYCLIFSQSDPLFLKKNLIEGKEELKIVSEKDLVSPLPSPSQKYLAFSRNNFKGVLLLDLQNGKVKEITDLDGSGFGFEWQNYEDLLGFRGSLGDFKKKHIICVAHPDGQIEVASPLLDNVSLPLWVNKNLVFALWGEKNKIKIVGEDKELFNISKVFLTSPEGSITKFDGKISENIKSNSKVFFLPRVSKDGSKYLFHSLDGGIYLLFSSDENFIKIGEGSNARFVRDDSAIIFEKTKDDGHKIIESDIYLYEITSKTIYQLTDTKEIVERMPSMGEDGHTVFWCENGKIMKGWVK